MRKADAARVVSSLKGADFFGKRLYSELADPERDYASASREKRRKRQGRKVFRQKKEDAPADRKPRHFGRKKKD